MAKRRKSASRRKSPSSRLSSRLISGQCAKAVAKMAQDGRRVVVVGRVKNGKVELEHSSLTEIARKFPKATMSFVAVNAPFDPVSNSNAA